MKTHLVRVVLVTAICCASQTSHAQEKPGDRAILIGFLLGGEKLTGAFAGGLNSGGTGGIEVQGQLPVGRLALRGDLTYHAYFPEDCVDVVQPGGTRSGGCGSNPWKNFFALSGDLVARLNNPATRWSPYILGGGALYAGTAKGGGALPSESGLQWGAGFEVRPRRRTVVFAEWRHMGMGAGGVSSVVMGARF